MRHAAIVLSIALGLSASPLLARHHDYRGYSSERAYRQDYKRLQKEEREREKAYRKAEREREKQYRKMMRHPDRYRGYSPYGYSNGGYYDPYGRYDSQRVPYSYPRGAWYRYR
jgi:hypothetical protein